MKRFLKHLFRKNPSRSVARKKTPLRLALHPLEDRLVPAMIGGMHASFEGGVLTVAGTMGNDVIRVRQINQTIKVDGCTGAFDATAVQRIEVYGQAGNDQILL